MSVVLGYINDNLLSVCNVVAIRCGILMHGTKVDCLVIREATINVRHSSIVILVLWKLLMQFFGVRHGVSCSQDFVAVGALFFNVVFLLSCYVFGNSKQTNMASTRLFQKRFCKLLHKLFVHSSQLP